MISVLVKVCSTAILVMLLNNLFLLASDSFISQSRYHHIFPDSSVFSLCYNIVSLQEAKRTVVQGPTILILASLFLRDEHVKGRRGNSGRQGANP
jgi:hypothetical protein